MHYFYQSLNGFVLWTLTKMATILSVCTCVHPNTDICLPISLKLYVIITFMKISPNFQYGFCVMKTLIKIAIYNCGHSKYGYLRGMILKFWSWCDISVTSNATCLKIVQTNNIFFVYTLLWHVWCNSKEWPETCPKTAMPSMHWPIKQIVHVWDVTI